jgi:hypothetical protein
MLREQFILLLSMRPNKQTAAQVVTRRPPRWIIPGQTLKVKNRVLNVQDAQVVFYPERRTFETIGDVIEEVHFWFRYPVEGATLYHFDMGSHQFLPLDPSLTSTATYPLWLVSYRGKSAKIIRQLYNDF